MKTSQGFDYGGWSVICLRVFTEHLLCVRLLPGDLFLLQEVPVTLSALWAVSLLRGCFSSVPLRVQEALDPVSTTQLRLPWSNGSRTHWSLRTCSELRDTAGPEAPFPVGRVAVAPAVLCPVRFQNLCPGLRAQGLAASPSEMEPLPSPVAFWIIPHLSKHSSEAACTLSLPDPLSHRHCPGTSLLPPAH